MYWVNCKNPHFYKFIRHQMKQKPFLKPSQFIEHFKNEETQFDLNDNCLEKYQILPLHDVGQKNRLRVFCTRIIHLKMEICSHIKKFKRFRDYSIKSTQTLFEGYNIVHVIKKFMKNMG